MEITRAGRDSGCLLLLLSDLFCIWSRKLHCLLLLCQLAYEFKLLLLEKGLSTHIFELVDADADLLVLLDAIASAVGCERWWACPRLGEASTRTLTNACTVVVEHHEVIAGEKRVSVQTQQAWSDQGRRLPDTTSRGRLSRRDSPSASTINGRRWLFYGLSLLLRLLALLCLWALWADFLDRRRCFIFSFSTLLLFAIACLQSGLPWLLFGRRSRLLLLFNLKFFLRRPPSQYNLQVELIGEILQHKTIGLIHYREMVRRKQLTCKRFTSRWSPKMKSFMLPQSRQFFLCSSGVEGRFDPDFSLWIAAARGSLESHCWGSATGCFCSPRFSYGLALFCCFCCCWSSTTTGVLMFFLEMRTTRVRLPLTTAVPLPGMTIWFLGRTTFVSPMAFELETIGGLNMV